MQLRMKIRNWSAYQGDSKRYSQTTWFRLENTIWMHALWDKLSDSEFRAAIFLFSYTSQKAHKTGELTLHLQTLCRMSGIPVATLDDALQKLEALDVVTISERSPGAHRERTVQPPVTNCATERYGTYKKEELKSAEQACQENGECTGDAPASPGASDADACALHVGVDFCQEGSERTVLLARDGAGQLSLLSPTDSSAPLKRSHRVKAGVALKIQPEACTGVSTAPPARNSLEGKKVSMLIGVYVKAWQKRYVTTARPDVGGKSQGVLKRQVASRTPEELSQLLQVYCQMRDPWFETKRHDLVTFEGNLGKIALARDKGHENGWDESLIFGDTEGGGENGTT